MLFPIRFALIVVCLAVLLTTSYASAECPNTSAGESIEDCPWAEVTRELVKVADGGGNPQGRIQQLLPGFLDIVAKDAETPAWKDFWGRSLNFDESAKETIVHPAIMGLFGSMIGISSQQDKVVHAGLAHTWGYLFSNLKTPFGYKRARWVRGDIESGFGLPRGSLGPRPALGTLFSNVTYFAGSLAFRMDRDTAGNLRKLALHVPPEFTTFDYTRLSPVRILETVEMGRPGGEARKIELRTDIVPFIKRVDSKNSHLLVYSVQDSIAGAPHLITAFPIDYATAQKLMDPKTQGERNKMITTKYNAFVDGLTGTTGRLGSRKIR